MHPMWLRTDLLSTFLQTQKNFQRTNRYILWYKAYEMTVYLWTAVSRKIILTTLYPQRGALWCGDKVVGSQAAISIFDLTDI